MVRASHRVARYIRTGVRLYRLGRRVYDAYGKLQANRSRSKGAPPKITSSTYARTVRRKSPVSGARLRYNTRGYGGRFKRRPRRVKAGRVRRLGTNSQIEKGGVVAGPDCIYVGHSFPGVQIFREISRSLIKLLFKKLGVSIISMNEKIQREGVTHVTPACCVLYLTYKADPGGVFLSTSATVPANDTFEKAAQFLITMFNTVFTSASTSDLIHFDTLNLRMFDNNGDVEETTTRLNLHQTIITVSGSSVMQIQNRTLAGAAAGPDQSNMLDVTNNPIDGRVYMGRGGGAMPKFADNTIALTNSSFIGSRLSGEISCVPSTANNWTSPMQTCYRRPPSAHAFSFVTRTSKCTLSPGQIKPSYLKLFFTMNFNAFVSKNLKQLYEYAQASGNDPHHWMGNFKFYGFEKRCATGVDEPDISVGYEVNTSISACAYEKAQVTVQDHLLYT